MKKSGRMHLSICLLFALLTVLAAGMILSAGCGRQEEKKLTVYTYASFPTALVDRACEDFQKKHGVELVFESFNDTGTLFSQLIREKEKPVADVVIGLDSVYFLRAAREDLFRAYRPKAADHIPADLVFDPEFRLTPFDFGYVLLNYDSEKLAQVPAGHQDLLDPAYQGKIILTNPLTSSPGQIFLLTTIALFGEDGYIDYWRALRKNVLAIAASWDEAYGMYTAGEAPIVLSYGTSPAYHILYENTSRYQPLVLDGAAYAQIEGVGILKGSKNPKTAELLIEYLLSPEFQALIPENQFMYPARSDVELDPAFRLETPVEKLLNLPLESVEANLDKWLAGWEQAIEG